MHAIALSVADQVRALVARHFDRDVDDVAAATRLGEDLDADTLDRIELALTLERHFGVAIEDAAIETWATVGDMIAALPHCGEERAVA